MVREVPSIEFIEADWQLKKRFGCLPTGIKIPFRLLVVATISGDLECSCAGRPECATTRAFSVPVPVPITVPISIEVLGALLRLVPYAGQIYTVAHILYVANKIIEKLGDVTWAFEPAARAVLESADLICEGKFDPSALVEHVLDIVGDIDL
jgi:hypothetical protein